MSAAVLRGDARSLPLPDESVDLIVTSVPYYGLRSYTDGGEHYEGQIGSEETPQQWLEALLDCTREMVRVLKATGSIFVNIGDTYAAGHGGSTTEGNGAKVRVRRSFPPRPRQRPDLPDPPASWSTREARVRNIVPGIPVKSLSGMPWRYALACIDELGLTLRAEIIWSKTNPVPESVTDRVWRTHESLLHFTVRPRYYCDIDEIREPQQTLHQRHQGRSGWVGAPEGIARGFTQRALSPLGKLPPSVWQVASTPLSVPPLLAHGRCCHGQPRPGCTKGLDHYAAFPPALVLPVVLAWSPPGGVVADPFGGTGTTALVASTHGRHGVTVDLSADYCHLARWRVNDPGEQARALGVPKPPPVPQGQMDLFGGVA